MKIKTFAYFVLLLLSITIVSNVYAEDKIEIEMISTKDSALYISWYPISNVTGYNINYLDKNKNVVFTDYVSKDECISNISDYNGISSIEIVGAKKDGTTVKIGTNLKYYKGFPLDVSPVILGCSNEENNRKIVLNSSLNISSARVYQGSWSALDLTKKEISKGSVGSYKILVEATLVNGRSVYGTYSGSNIDPKLLEAKIPECLIKGRGIEENTITYFVSNAPENVVFNSFNQLSEKIDSITVPNNGGYFSFTIPENTSKILILGADNGIDYLDDLSLEFNIPEGHKINHKPEPNDFLFEVNHPTTSISNEPYLYPKIVLGTQTLLDVMINNSIVYKNLSTQNMENLYLPLSDGDNNISMIAHTQDGQTSSRGFIVSYKNKDSQRLEQISNQNMAISFIGISNNATVTTKKPTIEGHVTGGLTLLVNDVPIDLDVNGDFKFVSNLKEGINSLNFKIIGPNDKTYLETLTLTYNVPNLINEVPRHQDGTKQYKEIPPEESKKIDETPLPAYEEVLEEDNDWIIYGAITLVGIIIFSGIVVKNIRSIKKNKKGER